MLVCLAAAVAAGTMAIFGKLAYAEGASVGTVLGVRFALAAVVFWIVVAARREWKRAPSRRDALLALGLGAGAYSAQAGAYFAALERLDAGLLSLLVYTFPLIVTVAAVALGRERGSRRTACALGLASGGMALVVAGAGTGALDPIGASLAILTAFIYAAYVLTSARVAERVAPLMLSTLICTGAAITLTAAGAAGGSLDLGAVSAQGLGWLTGIAMISTVAAVSLFLAGVRRVGPSRASILSTAEPLTTVALAFAAFGEALGTAQLAGGSLVLGAVVVLGARQ